MIAGINRLVDIQQADIQRLSVPVTQGKNITLDVLRLDKIHATISGNKWFKLRYALEAAILSGSKTILTFGGAYSNHLLATAYACSNLGLQSVGVIRGERPEILSDTLTECNDLGMQLHFISREAYSHKGTLSYELLRQFPGAYLIPEGGADADGVKGAADIAALAKAEYSHICCAVGTGTMMAGLMNGANEEQLIIGISALKLPEHDNSIEEFIAQATGNKPNYKIWYDYHFGGYARKTPELLSFMNALHAETRIPTDFVYTAKLFYGVLDLVEKDRFPRGSRLLIIHSGGLQGNRSLPKNSLRF